MLGKKNDRGQEKIKHMHPHAGNQRGKRLVSERCLAGADNDKMVKVRVQRSEREYLARVLRHAKRNEGSKID